MDVLTVINSWIILNHSNKLVDNDVFFRLEVRGISCQTKVEGVEQQFKYTQPAVCRNPVCNNRSRFILDINKSRYKLGGLNVS